MFNERQRRYHPDRGSQCTSSGQVLSVLKTIARSYQPDLVASQLADIERIAFHIGLALGASSNAWRDMTVCDVGGGVGLFSVGCRALGVRRSVLIDDFGDAVNVRAGASALEPHRKYGVEILSRNVITGGLGAAGPFDVVTSFDSMEHWHGSPRRLFAEVIRELKPGGSFVLGVPNCVNLRKRITVAFGYGKWSNFSDWYAQDIFRGHVREPDVDDLRRIAAAMGLKSYEIVGRNWLGLASDNGLIRNLTRVADYILRLRPTLCSDIYLVGHKPAT